MTLGILILTGGASRRMGEDKAAQLWDGERAVDLLARLGRELGAEFVMTVGPRDFGLPAVTDEAPGAGPVAGLLAGLRALEAKGAVRALVLATDAPTIEAGDLGPLIDAAAPGAAYDGLPLPMIVDLAAPWREFQAHWPLRRAVEHAGLEVLAVGEDARGRIRGANTPGERDALL